ncbi:diaminopimelate decarboxylase [Miltoncostaea marina]|uniref:diaminopimelate decarboxylase n=1 Tax=Miltoncostaea marina TaxID=2843215 RepID=UPI001C3D77DD|nr:diaminopimelate decarboxylase [Miltoncostaea marina]
MMPLAQVLPPSAAITAEGHLSIGGCDLVALAEEHGTPLVVYDEGALRGMARAYREAFAQHAPDVDVIYASKAYFGQAMLRLACEEGLCVDVASGGELYAALAAGFPPERIYLHGNNKDAREIGEALDAGVGTAIVDNMHEIGLWEREASARGVRQRLLVRVTPGVKPSTHSYISTGQLDSKFGFSIEGGAAREAVDAIRAASSLDLVGLHCHIGSQLFDLSGYGAAAAIVADFAAACGGDDLRLMDMGGGLGIAYTRDDHPAAVEDYADAVMEAVRAEWARVGLPMPRVAVEPGRSIVGRAGVTLYRVGATKTIPGVRTYAAVDGGMSDLLRPMLYGAVYEPLLANRPDDEPTQTLRLVGKHCESGDVLVGEAALPPVAAGDVVCLPATGAYGVSMASNYNGVTRPAVVFVDGGEARVVTRRETYADLIARDV